MIGTIIMAWAANNFYQKSRRYFDWTSSIATTYKGGKSLLKYGYTNAQKRALKKYHSIECDTCGHEQELYGRMQCSGCNAVYYGSKLLACPFACGKEAPMHIPCDNCEYSIDVSSIVIRPSE